jgi:hypothetical protein
VDEPSQIEAYDTEIQVIKAGRGIKIHYGLQEQTGLAMENCAYRYSVIFDHSWAIPDTHEVPQPGELPVRMRAAIDGVQRDAPTSSTIKMVEFTPISRSRTTKARRSVLNLDEDDQCTGMGQNWNSLAVRAGISSDAGGCDTNQDERRLQY